MSSAREEIIQNIRESLGTKVPEPFPEVTNDEGIYPELDPNVPLEVRFAEECIKLNTTFVFSENWSEFTDNLKVVINQLEIDAISIWHPHIQKIVGNAGIEEMKISTDLSKSKAGLITAECLVARTGSVCVSPRNKNGRTLGIYPEIVIVVAATDQIVPDMKDAFEFLEQKYGSVMPSMLSFMSGPSRTADIEKTLVLGAHGPKQVIVMLVDNPES